MRFLIRALFVVVLAVVVFVVGVFLLVPSDRIARVVENQFQQTTGRSMHIGGKISPTFFPSIGVNATDIRIDNADWAGTEPMVTAKNLAVNVSTLDLFRGKITVQGIDLKSPTIRLQVATDGRANWDFSNGTESSTSNNAVETGSGAIVPKFTIDKGEISNAHLIYDDAAGGQFYDISSLNALLQLPDFDGEAQIDVDGEMNDQSFAIEGTLAEFSTFLAGKLTPVSLNVEVGANNVSVDGNLGHAPLAADMKIDADVPELSAVFALINQVAPELPVGFGQKIAVKGDLKYTPDGAVYLRETEIILDQNSLNADVDLFLTDKPKLRALVSADTLDFSGAMASGSEASAEAENAAETGWSKAPMDFSFLSLFDGDIALRVSTVNLGDVVIGPIDTLSKLSNSRLVNEINKMGVYGGDVDGKFVVNNRNGLSVGGNLAVADIALNPLLKAMAGYERLQGAAKGNFKFLASGNSLDLIMNSFSGSGKFNIGKGEIIGFDLAGMLRNLDASYQGSGNSTIFDGISASFDIENGTLSNNDLLFDAPLLTAKGAGDVGIGKQTLNYRVTPTEVLGGNIKVPVLISGTWANPKFKPDLENLFDAELEEQKKKLEAQAQAAIDAEKKKLEDKVKDNLGLQPDGEGSVEDQLKEKLEDELIKGLGNLFGNN